METRVALIGIIVENSESSAQLNALLHDAGKADEYRLGYSCLALPTRGKPVGHRNTIIAWTAAALPLLHI